MDPIAVLQNRIEQLEAKLGMNMDMDGQQMQQGDTVTGNLLNAAQAMSTATAGHEKLSEAMNVASELNNYTDPNYAANAQQNEIHMQEVVAAENMIQHHCHCMNRCKQAAPVLESEPMQQVPQMQETVDQMHMATAQVKAEADQVSQGVQQLAETCGSAALESSEQLASVAQKVQQVEEIKFPKRRNGLD